MPNIGPTERQKEIMDRITERWEKLDKPLDAHTFTKSIMTGSVGAMLHSFVNFKVPPTVLLDVIMNVAADHTAGLLATLITSDIITEGEAREMIVGSGAALEDGINKMLTRLHDQMAFVKMMADDEEEETRQ